MIRQEPHKRHFAEQAKPAQREPNIRLKPGRSVITRAFLSPLTCAAGLLIAQLVAHPLAADTVYKVVDEEGNVTFTDTPPSDASAIVEAHSLLGTNITPAVSATQAATEQTARPDEVPRYVTRITSPASETTIPMGPGDFTVEADVSPNLETGEQLILMLDGKPVNAPQLASTWQLTNVFRGEHRLQIVRVTEEGEPQSKSPEHTVYVMRPTVGR